MNKVDEIFVKIETEMGEGVQEITANDIEVLNGAYLAITALNRNRGVARWMLRMAGIKYAELDTLAIALFAAVAVGVKHGEPRRKKDD